MRCRLSGLGHLRRWFAPAVVLVWLAAGAGPALATQPPPAPAAGVDGVQVLLTRLEQAIRIGTPQAYLALVSQFADREAAQSFAEQSLGPGVTFVALRERDRGPLEGTLPGNGYRLVVDAFIQRGAVARLVTWRIDVRRNGGSAGTRSDEPAVWSIAGQTVLGAINGIHHLTLDPSQEFDARDLVVHAEDFELRLPAGVAFVARADDGVTALVVLGRGEMVFRPAPETERGQVKIFCGSETLDTPFDAAFVRVSPGDFANHVAPGMLVPRATDDNDLKRATDVFQGEMAQSFSLDLSEFSPDTWSILPTAGDFLAEVRTDKYGTLTYARSMADPEDITLFDRRHLHNISLYASKEKLAERGPFYNEDDLADYVVRHYDVNASLDPARLWISGRTEMTIRVRSSAISHLTLRLAEPLTVRDVYSQQYGRLLSVRIRNQNSIVVNLPAFVTQGTEFSLTITYAGRLEPQPTSRETVGVGAQQFSQLPPHDGPRIDPEPSFLYSNQSYWYPQSPIDGYATATLRLTVPQEYQCVASGAKASGSPVALPAAGSVPPRKLYVFVATQPLRYLACIISRFVDLQVDPVTVTIPRVDRPAIVNDDPAADHRPGVYYDSLKLSVETTKRQLAQEKPTQERAADIAKFYASLMGDCPYPTFTVALVESYLPGGHSPGYFAALNQPLPSTPYTWRNDPASFHDYPEFFLAHELAHQWWGQAVGPANYHEQWLSEGFAQYFAALYAQHYRGEDVFEGILHQMRQWALQDSDQGPIYLGYRLGHIRNDSRVYRALVYDKAALVLHMLRRLLGDKTFFAGLRRFYMASRFRKVGTDDLRKAMEAEAHQPLGRFFDRWIYGDKIPRVQFSYRTEDTPNGQVLVLHAEQETPDLFDLPVTVTVQYSDGPSHDLVMPIHDRVDELRVPLTGRFRGIDLNRDDAALAEFDRK
jgi:Peptidase family M1 domain